MSQGTRCNLCGFHNPPGRARCVRCSAMLGSRKLEGAEKRAGKLRDMPDPLAPLRRLAYAVGRRFDDSLPTGVPHRFPWTAGYLGLLFGAGQWYNYQPKKAMAMGLVQAGLLAWWAVNFFHPASNLILLLTLGWSLYMMADAFSAAVRINGQPWRLKFLFAVWFSLFFFVGFTLFVFQCFGYGVFNLTTVRSTGMGPQLERGDKVFTLMRWFAPGDIRPGDVVYFRQTYSYTYQDRTGSTYTVREQTSFGVVTALEGQTVERIDDGHIFVDGEPVPPELLPINPDGFPSGFRIEVPEGHYAVLPTHAVTDRGIIAMLAAGGLSVRPPREMLEQGLLLRNYDRGSIVAREDIYGIVLFRYHPPPRREWFGRGGGLWSNYPEGFLAEPEE